MHLPCSVLNLHCLQQYLHGKVGNAGHWKTESQRDGASKTKKPGRRIGNPKEESSPSRNGISGAIPDGRQQSSSQRNKENVASERSCGVEMAGEPNVT